MKRKLIFLMAAALLLTPWPVAYAYGSDTAGHASVQVEAAPTNAAPRWNAYGNAIGGVTAGDLFYIDATNTTTDIPVTLVITNTDQLIHSYRYLTLNVGVYTETGTGWEKATTASGEILPDTYIAMTNGQVSFKLAGYARYKITINNGCFYSYGNDTEKGSAIPAFYLTTQ